MSEQKRIWGTVEPSCSLALRTTKSKSNQKPKSERTLVVFLFSLHFAVSHYNFYICLGPGVNTEFFGFYLLVNFSNSSFPWDRLSHCGSTALLFYTSRVKWHGISYPDLFSFSIIQRISWSCTCLKTR
jgi:hypothetical protein